MVVITTKKPDSLYSQRFTVKTVGLLLTSLFVSVSASAADWKLVPSVNLVESYTDNLRLAKSGDEQGSFVTQVTPSIAVTANGKMLQLQANYSMQNSYYSGADHNIKTANQLAANARATLLENIFFLDANATVGQQQLSPFGQQPFNNLNLTSNNVNVKTYTVTPSLNQRFGNYANGKISYTYGSVTSGSQVTAENTLLGNLNGNNDNFKLSVNSGTAFKSLSWGFNYTHQNFKSERQTPYKTENTGLNLGYALSSQFNLTSSAGYEKNSFNLNSQNTYQRPSGSFATIGFFWAPTERTSVNFNLGHRFYGKTYSLALNQRARASVWSLSYNEEVTSTAGQFLLPATNNTSAFLNQLWQTSIPDATTRQITVDNFIRNSGLPSSLSQATNTFSNDVFLQKSLQGSVGFTGARNSVVLNVFKTKRETLSAGIIGIANQNASFGNNQTGYSALWNTQFSPLTNLGISANYTKADGGFRSNTKTYRATMSRKLQPKVNANLEVRHVQQDSNYLLGNYKENAITLYFFLGF